MTASLPTGPLLGRLRDTLSNEMPITQSLGVQVHGLEGERIVLGAPLARNRNHQGTAFAGSVNALATLTGWARVWVVLAEAGVEAAVVVQDSSIRYLRPVTADFTASCAPLPSLSVDRMLAAVRKHGRGRITIAVTVQVDAVVVAEFGGRYVAVAGGGRGRVVDTPPRTVMP